MGHVEETIEGIRDGEFERVTPDEERVAGYLPIRLARPRLRALRGEPPWP